jgi:co-chaperonin GroES (HSP10)
MSVQDIDLAFPVVDAGVEPLGSKVLLQIRRTKTKTKGGIILVAETSEVEKWNQQIAKVISVGPLAFRNRTTMELWPEGAWVKPGDFVRCPKYGGDRWEVDLADGAALFLLINDLEIIGRVTGDPLGLKAFI